MQQAISPANISRFVTADHYITTEKKELSIFSKFINWCESQEENRMLWLALSFLGLIGVAVPVTLAAVSFLAGNNFNLWIAVCVINVPVFAINLAAQPTKITVPSLFLAWITDAVIILYCTIFFLMH